MENVYDVYCEGKRLIGMLQYFKTRKSKKERELINDVGLSRVVETSLKQTIKNLKNSYILDGYSDTMKREICVMTSMHVNDFKTMPFVQDKFMRKGEGEARAMLKNAKQLYKK